MDPLAWIDDEIDQLAQNHLIRSRATRESPPVAGMVQMDGRQFINFGSNDYLGIAASEALVLAVQKSVCQLGFGSGASPLVNGRGTIHRKLEQSLAKFENREDSLLFPTGYAANVGTICSLVGKSDVIFSDELNHASIIDGCRLSGAEIVVYPHADMDRLQDLLRQIKNARRKLIVTDGLFSMDGDIAPLPQICELARQHDAMLMVDEAHATGVLGDLGKGSAEHLGVADDVDVIVGTLSKALGCLGGFVAGNKNLIDYIFNRARPLVFSTAQPEAISAAALESLRIVESEPERRIKLLNKSQFLRDSLSALGLNIGISASQIIPVMLGGNQQVLRFSEHLQQAGFFVPAIRAPSVPENQERLRFSVSYSHSSAQLSEVVNCIKSIQK